MSPEELAAFVADPIEPSRFSVSFMRAAEGCIRRAHADRSSARTNEPAQIGNLVHEITAAVGFRAVMRGELEASPWTTADVADRVLATPEDVEPVPLAAWDEALGLLDRWVQRARFYPGEQFEINSRQELADKVVSARIDRLALVDNVAHVRDYKSGWAGVPDELPLQGKLYGWHAFRLYPEIDHVVYVEDHLRFRPSRPFVVTRDDAAEVERWMIGKISRLRAAYAAGGELPVLPGTSCSQFGHCPVADSCPVVAWDRPESEVTTETDALAEFEQLLVDEARIATRKAKIKGYVEGAGIRALQHNGEEFGLNLSEGKSFDKRRLLRDLESKGVEIDPEAYNRSTKPSFGRRKAK